MSQQLIVETQAGKVRGAKQCNFEGDEFYAFRGIPYAKPPVRQLRFKDPEPAEPWTGIREAMSHGPYSAQLDYLTNFVVGSDDCLYLNVYTRNLESNVRRPVMVWIHGGGFALGHGDDSLYGPDYFMRKDVVLVTINYRLGALGFLNFNDEVATGNQGLKDQVMALRWVRDNIANFGGDSTNVTIFGESAGAAAVHYLALSSSAKGLFHKVIAQSGVALNAWAFQTNPEEHAYRLCELLGHTEKDPKSAVKFLQEIDVQKLIEAQARVLKKEEKYQFVLAFGPSIDSKSKQPLIPVHPEEAAKQSIEVPLMIGHNDREGIIFLRIINRVYSRFIAESDNILHPNVVTFIREEYDLTPENLISMYFGNDDITNENMDKLVDLYGDLHFVEGIQRVAQIQIEKSSEPTYFYQFTYDKGPSLLKMMSKTQISGASHADEIFYLFAMQSFTTMKNQFNIPVKSYYQMAKWFIMMIPIVYLVKFTAFGFPKKGSDRYRIIEQMIDMWVSFAATGKPTNGPSELIPVDWQPVNDSNELRFLNICEDLRMEVAPNLRQKYDAHKSAES